MTAAEFENEISTDLAWRKKEISDLLISINQTNEEVILKSALLLLYAHWEGYIKRSSKAYLIYVSNQAINNNDLSSNFYGITLKSEIAHCYNTAESMKMEKEIDFINKFMQVKNQNFTTNIQIDARSNHLIDTQSNLAPKVFYNILKVLGLRKKEAFSLREHYINEQLLNNRNGIGHGNKFSSTNTFDLTFDHVKKLKNIILAFIDSFKDELIEFVDEKLYLKLNEAKIEETHSRIDQALEANIILIENE